jgi:protein gp37
MGKTTISWTDHSVNPIRARHRVTGKVGHFCEKVSPGCANCYSSALQSFRFGTPAFSTPDADQMECFLDEGKLAEVRRRRAPTKWFWCDMTDFCGEWMLPEWYAACFATMAATPQHTHMLLTKRPERLASCLPADWGDGYPSVWLGTSVENQRWTSRLEALCALPAAVHFASVEPLLGPVDLAPWLDRLSWVIIGGESGAPRRPMDLAWLLAVVAQCQAAGVAVWVKQDAAFRDGQQGRIPDDIWKIKQFPTLQGDFGSVSRALTQGVLF